MYPDALQRQCAACRSILPWVVFFKQKTAYEMRISDWSSDVCSSDLSPEFTARLVDRWQELESQANGSNVTFMVPKSLPEALRLAADLEEKIEVQQGVIKALEPKAEFHDAVASAINCQTVQE